MSGLPVTKVEIPKMLRVRPKDKRGYPIGFIVFIRKDGSPEFTVNDMRRVERCLKQRLCGLCGRKIDKGHFHFIGGPQSTFSPLGRYIDPPMHKECATYALSVCPYLAGSFYKKSIADGVKARLKDTEPGRALVELEPNSAGYKPNVFILTHAKGYSYELDGQHSYIRPLDRLGYEYWRDGQIITDNAEKAAIFKEGIGDTTPGKL